MAAGGYDKSFDSRVSCSICLEPYRGRQPKLLPCSHTFCLPCLTQIANRNDSQPVGGAGDGNGAAAPVTLTCPTCRTPVPLPPAGVSGLHNNIYVDDSGSHDPRPFLCDLCEEGQSAKLNCSTCKTYFCTRCRRTHDKLCKTGQVTEIEDQTKQAAPLEVVDMLQAVLKKLSGEAQQGVTPKEAGAREKILSLAVAQSAFNADVTDVKSLSAVVQQLMQKQTETEKQVAMLQNQNALLCRDLASLHEKNGRERKEFDALQREVVSLKDKIAIMCQDNQLLRTDVTKLQGEVDKHQGELSQLKTQTSQTQGQGEITALKNSQAQLQGDVSVLQADVKKVKADQGGMQSNFDRTRNKLQDDLKKILTQVAFHARLVKNVEPKKDDIIVCDEVEANVGGGYNSVTGIFTAPVSGMYCFVANASPHSSDATTGCCADIVVDDKNVAHLLAYSRGNCTAHVSLSVKAGQKVWLKSGSNSYFHAGWLTSFTGFLVQAEL